LEIEAAGDALHLSNAVKLGAVELRFRGPGRLLGSRPLLEFWFERLELRLAGRLVLQRSLSAPGTTADALFCVDCSRPGGLAGGSRARRWSGAVASTEPAAANGYDRKVRSKLSHCRSIDSSDPRPTEPLARP
jgi:hypothetical protein